MQDSTDAGQIRYSTGWMQDRTKQDLSDAGKDICSAGQMQDSTDAEQVRYITGQMQDRTYALQDGCRTHQMQDSTYAVQDV